MVARILHRYKKANVWAEMNPILGSGEIGIESDTNLSKLGDGIKRWNSLPYVGARNEDQKYFLQSMARAPRESEAENLRGILAILYTGMKDSRTDRMLMYLNKTIISTNDPEITDFDTKCELIPVSEFADLRIGKADL